MEEHTDSFITGSRFIKAIKVYIDKPHLINKKICGVENEWTGTCSLRLQFDEFALKFINILQDQNNISNFNVDSLAEVLTKFSFHCVKSKIKSTPWNKDNDDSVAIIRRLLPKNIEFCQPVIEVVVIDFTCHKILFVSEMSSISAKILPEFAYVLHLDKFKIHLRTFQEINCANHGMKWLNHSLIPTLAKWAQQMDEKEPVSSSSLCLINISDYNRTYQSLKRKYKTHLMEIWTETTDPQKFIHEDIGIASYLITLWEQERTSKQLNMKQSFLDLGCGNGLLVYILAAEGYPGMGIDVKKRKLWDQFPDFVHLKEDVILPSDKCLYPEYDWLIGNHSDELTPWLPILSAKSSINCRYFLIPCCAYDFQSKFQRSKNGMSQYAEYLDYIQELGSICGFEVWRDKLRIPSTKRTCFVGQNRTYKLEDWDSIVTRINEFVYTRCNSLNTEPSLHTTENWCQNFKPREPVQQTRNCTQISTEIRDKIVNDIGRLLLSHQHFAKIKKNEGVMSWNRGGVYSFQSLVSSLSKEQLKHLKSECGGLQTLLRNHKYIFKIEKANISLRIPEPRSLHLVRSDLIKTKPCWFYVNHPQGCTLENDDCTYIHS